MATTETAAVLPEIPANVMDGNYDSVEDARWPESQDERFLLDADGEKIEKGAWVQVLEGHSWAGRICRVEEVHRADIYERRGRRIEVRDPGIGWFRAWSPTSSLNRVGLAYQRSSFSAKASEVRRVDLTPQDGWRHRLTDLLGQRGVLDQRAADIESARLSLDIEIRRVRAKLGEDALA